MTRKLKRSSANLRIRSYLTLMEKKITSGIILLFFVLGFYMGVLWKQHRTFAFNLSIKNAPLIATNRFKFCLSMFIISISIFQSFDRNKTLFCSIDQFHNFMTLIYFIKKSYNGLQQYKIPNNEELKPQTKELIYLNTLKTKSILKKCCSFKNAFL